MKQPSITASIALTILVASLRSNLQAATFEILFPVGPPYAENYVRVSDDGSIVLGSNWGRAKDAYLWEQSKGYSTIPYRDDAQIGMSGDGKTILSCSYPSSSCPVDASFDGSVIAGLQNPFPFPTAVGIFNGQVINLGKLNGDNASRASAVSADGSTIVGQSFSSRLQGLGYPIYRMEPFRWTAETGMVPLGTLPGAFLTHANDVSGDGGIIVGKTHFSNGDEEAFRWTAATGIQSLGDLSGARVTSEAFAVSADGRIIVGHGRTDNKFEAFIWDESHGMRKLADVLLNEHNLDVGHIYLRNATGVSANGRIIVGWGTDFTDHTFAWRVDLIPEPSSFVLCLVTFGIWYSYFSRRR